MQLKWLVREAVLQRCRIAGSLAESRRCGVADFWGEETMGDGQATIPFTHLPLSHPWSSYTPEPPSPSMRQLQT